MFKEPHEMKKPTKEERASALPLAKLSKLFQLIAILRAGRWTIPQLVERFDSSKSSMYRYLELLEESGFHIEKDFHNRYFIVTTEDDPLQAQFTLEELNMLRTLVQGDARNPLTAMVMKKLSLNSEVDRMPRLFLKAHLGNLVEQLTDAMRTKHQVMLKNYHSANSDKVSDRLVEPIHFGDNYATIVALEVADKKCKQFKLDRIGEVQETHQAFAYESLHEAKQNDIFGLAGEASQWITLQLSARAYLLLREEFPMALPYLTRSEDAYAFKGPVAGYSGIGRFVLGLIDEIEIKAPGEFKTYIDEKLNPNKRRHSISSKPL